MPSFYPRFVKLLAYTLPLLLGSCLYGAYDRNYNEIAHPDLDMSLQGMRTHQIQWYIYHQYTTNLDVPGYLENGGYNYSKKGKLEVLHFLRFRASEAPIETNNPWDFTIDGTSRGFFCIRLPKGKIGYTRDGRFKLTSSRRLVTRAGEFPILNEGEQEIILPPGADVAVSKSGVLFVDNNPIDKLKVIIIESEKQANEVLDSVNGSVLFEANGKLLTRQNPFYAVRQGFLDGSNVLKALTGDGLYAKYGNEASAKAAKSTIKTMTSAVQMANP